MSSLGFGGSLPVNAQPLPIELPVDDPGALTPTDQQAHFIGTEAGTYPNDHIIHNHYEVDGKTYAMGLTTPNSFQGASTAFVKLASDVLIWICDWTASQWGAIPDVPDPSSVSSDWILLDTYFGTVSINNNTGADKVIYRISGTYSFGHKNPPKEAITAVKFGRPPWVDTSFSRNVPATVLKPNLAIPQEVLSQTVVYQKPQKQ